MCATCAARRSSTRRHKRQRRDPAMASTLDCATALPPRDPHGAYAHLVRWRLRPNHVRPPDHRAGAREPNFPHAFAKKCNPSCPERTRMGVAGAPGFEPGMAEPKSAALPLGYAPSPLGHASSRQRGQRADHIDATRFDQCFRTAILATPTPACGNRGPPL